MAMKRIRLELARNKEFPNGSARHGYEISAPLDDDGHLLAAEWREARALCRVRRFWAGETDEIGYLVHRQGGAWVIDYDLKQAADDERGYKLDKHRLTPGEYVSITEHDGVLRTFRVADVSSFD
jgi:hypothetical protein